MLALALPVFLMGGFPLVAYAIVAVAWIAQRLLQSFATRPRGRDGRQARRDRRARGHDGRPHLAAGLSVLAAGLIEREAGVAAGLLAVALFTTFFVTLLIVKPLEEAARPMSTKAEGLHRPRRCGSPSR